jgi:hypothetical protein
MWADATHAEQLRQSQIDHGQHSLERYQKDDLSTWERCNCGWIMYSPFSLPKQQCGNQRLVQAAATEKFSANRKQLGQKLRPIIHRDGDVSSVEEREMTDDSSTSEDMLIRCNITVVTNNASDDVKTSSPRAVSKKSLGYRVKKHRQKTKKSVRFHKYDEVIYTDVTEYIYSLHDLEVEHEKASRDLVDDIEGVVGDVGYFLRCLQEGIQEEAAKSLGDRRETVNY